jgi:hypothetical protein
MKTEIEFHDPFFTSSHKEEKNGLKISYPIADERYIKEVTYQIRQNAEKYFSTHSVDDIRKVSDEVDSSFNDLTKPENVELIDLIQRSSGFSKYDIKNWGLGLFSSIDSYDPKIRGYYISKAIKEKGIIQTSSGYLKRFGYINPFNKWKEPTLLSHFISGNVVGYTAILSKIGLPVKIKGTAQILKLPSAASFFPMVYLQKLETIDPDLRKTIVCGYWKGGDDLIERPLIEESDAINILSSDQAIKDLLTRIEKYHRGITVLQHGHKIGIAYISREFINDPDRLEQTINGLVTDISAFDGGACYNVKNIYVQGDPRKFAEMLFSKLEHFEKNVSNVSNHTKSTGLSLYQIYSGSNEVISSDEKNVFVRVKENPEFWKPDELFRYVQVMRVNNENEVYGLIRNNKHYLQTAIIAVPDEKIVPLLLLFGKAGISNIHYPGSAPLINVYEEPHDGEFDAIRVRYNYSARFAATNFKFNKDWIEKEYVLEQI